MIALVVRQLAFGGTNPRSGARVPPVLRATLAVQAAALVVAGALLYIGSDALRADLWPWALTPLTAKAVGTWLIGIGVIAGYIAVVDDRADIPGNSVAYLVLGFASLAGLYGALLSLREGLYAASRAPGGIPVEVRHRASGGAARRTSEAARRSPRPVARQPPPGGD